MFAYRSQWVTGSADQPAKRVIFIAALLGSVTTVVQAQTARAAAQTCGENETVGWLGISGLSCLNCVFTAPGRGEPILFGTEPRVTSVASGSPAADVIRPGDVLVSVDGALITTHAGGMRFNNLKPGEDVTVIVRRNGESQTHRLEDLPAICRTDRRVPGAQVPPGEYMSGARAGQGGGRVATAPVPRSAPPPGAAVGPVRQRTPPLPSTAPPPGQIARTRVASVPRASFGFSISCGRCVSRVDPDDGTVVWEFEQSPQIYSVDENSEAYRAGIRRGDVITRIDGRELTSPEGGRRFGAVAPGQRVEFTIRRGSQTLTRAVRAEPTVAARIAQFSRQRETAIDEARRLTEELQRHQRVESAQLERLRRTEDERIRTLAEQLRRQQTEQNTQLAQLHAELARADQELRASGRSVPATPSAGIVTVPGERTMRYVGRLSDVDIEVRGGSQIRVTETPNEYVITIGDSEIRLKKINR